MGSMGQDCTAKTPRGLVAQKHSSVLKGPSSKGLMEVDFFYELMDPGGDSELYCPLSVLEWLENKNRRGSSIIWKVMVQYFDLIGTGLVWRVGSRSRVRLGMDLWFGRGRTHILPEEICLSISDRWILFLSQVADLVTTNIWNQGCMGGDCYT